MKPFTPRLLSSTNNLLPGFLNTERLVVLAGNSIKMITGQLVSWSAHNPITICIGGTACLLFHRMFLHTKSRPLGIQKLSSSSSSDSSAKRCITTSYSRRETYETRSEKCSRKLCTEHGAVRRIRQVSSAEACNPSPDEWFGPDGYLALCRC